MKDKYTWRQEIPDENPKIPTRSQNRRGNIPTFFSHRSICLGLLWIAYIFICGSFLEGNRNSIFPMMAVVSAMRTLATTTLRRSARLRGASPALASAAAATPPEPDLPKKTQKRFRSKSLPEATEAKKKKPAKRKTKPKANKTKKDDSTDGDDMWCLPRTRETSLLLGKDGAKYVMGVDEAGRGPLAGPVVAAAAIVPTDIDGITDSKKITKEEDRENLYKAITESPNVRWAVAVMDAPFIDKVNILQATMRAMEACSTALAADEGPHCYVQVGGDEKVPILPELDYNQEGCYLITSKSKSDGETKKKTKGTLAVVKNPDEYRALVDGNRIPPNMPCESESIVKGDSKEYAIAAASILAKVSRDRLMRDYHELWPHFGLDQHKGYPTAAHMAAVRTYGASKIHRRTFKPLKDMTFDEEGKVLTDGSGSRAKNKK